MRLVRGTAATAPSRRPRARRERTWKECPKMNSGFVLLEDSWWSFLTAGIFLPSLGTLSPSATKTR
jgi:hypothetical protein